MKILFLDCISGISGDMTVGALTDLGVSPSTFEWELSKVDLGDFHLHFEPQTRQGIAGIKFGIHEGATHEHGEHSHEHGEHSHGRGEPSHGRGEPSHERGEPSHERGEHSHEHGEPSHERGEHSHERGEPSHEHGEHSHERGEHSHERGEPSHEHGEHSHERGEHSHEHGEHSHERGEHSHGRGEHSHERNHREIRELIAGSSLSAFVKEKTLAIFQRIAVAEGKIHGQPPAEVAFHEVGALDSIADIVCTCAGLEALGVERVFASRLFDGTGWLQCAHGRFPIPAPATLEILAGIPLRQIDAPFEFITPTGAAILAEFAQGFGPMPELKIQKIGYGLGSREIASHPNVLRAVLGDGAISA